MLRVYSCLAGEHDLWLVLLAGAICLLGAVTSFAAFEQARLDAARRIVWVALAALVSGIGIWSTHFVAMLAYRPGLPIGYDLPVTLLSVVAAVLICGCGWAVAIGRSRIAAAAGGILLGLGVGTMHYIGMSAVMMPARIEWDRQLVLVSLVLGIALAGAAIASHGRMRSARWAAPLLLTLAICGLHFTAMAAAVVHPDPTVEVPNTSFDSNMLAVAVAAAALLILVVGFGLVLFDRSLTKAQLAEAKKRSALAEEVLRGAADREMLSAELERQADITNAALNNMAQGLSMYDEQDRLVTYNSRYAEIYGAPPELLKEGTPILAILDHLASISADTDKLEYYVGETSRASERESGTTVYLSDGRIIDVQRRPLPQGGWVATHEDVTEKRKTDQRIAYLATHDPLTDLPNRVAFGERLKAAAAGARRGQRFALHTIDLDRFKEVNDTLGHPVGDEILREVSGRLRAMVREGDSITRLGGDEFALLQAGIAAPEDAAKVAARIIEALSEPIRFDGHTVAIGASIGIALAPSDGQDADELLKMSDLALYRAKADSRGSFRFFEAGMDLNLRERRELETDLRAAVREGQFELHYQPLMDLNNRSIDCFEALIRWHHPTRGMIQPLDFITLAEECGLIIPIGEWVLRQACRDAASWPADIRVAVNLSPAQFKRGDLVAMTMSALAAAELAPERLELEITESVLIHDEAWVRTTLEQLRAVGVRIAMDDFGTGYSSLSYLRSFPFSKIKIDRSFIADLAGTTDSLAIVQATIQLSEKLGMKTTAEGVETAEQLAILRAEGCTQAQGYHVSRPVPAGDIAELLRRYDMVEEPAAKAA